MTRPDPPTSGMDISPPPSPPPRPSPPANHNPPQEQSALVPVAPPALQPVPHPPLPPQEQSALISTPAPPTSTKRNVSELSDADENESDSKRVCDDFCDTMVVYDTSDLTTASVSDDGTVAGLPLQNDPTLWRENHQTAEEEFNFDPNYNKMVLPRPDLNGL